MQELDDMALLEAYARQKSEGAFETLVARHINMVYSAALRQSGNPQLAQEITQATFIILARKAGSLGRGTFLAGWLLRTARFASATELRTSLRRQRHENEAHMESLIQQEGSANPDWAQIAPFLDEALAELGALDRKALVLRFFEQKPFKEVGTLLGVDEDSAQKRVSRAVDKLRRTFVKRGMILPAVTIAAMLSANAVHAAPTGLAAAVATAAGLQATAAASSTATLIKGTLKLMVLTKAKTVVVAGVIVLLAAGTTTVIVKHGSSGSSATPSRTQANATSSTPVSQPALTAWQQGDKSTAISRFREADWTARPLFAADSILSLSENQFKDLSNNDRQARSGEMTAQLASFKQLAAAVAQAGSDAAAKGDSEQAKKYFISLQQCGAALAGPENLQIVQLVGKAVKNIGDTDMAKIGQ